YFRMSLTKILNSRPDSPSSQPPTLRIAVIRIKIQDKVLAWDFQENGEVKPICTKTNRVAIVTDGTDVTKITIFQGFADHVKEASYFLKGYVLRGESPPYAINIVKTTKFFRTTPLQWDPELLERAELLLQPASEMTPLASREVRGLLTVEGEVLQVS
ncbi:hypothetical protein GBF38_014791, partial [Nibea albiflora]